jgi:hypothetical protein
MDVCDLIIAVRANGLNRPLQRQGRIALQIVGGNAHSIRAF